jgi:hypothetical protein
MLVKSKTDASAVIEWTTDELNDNMVQYGTRSSSWGHYPSSQSNGSMVTNHSITLTGLAPGTTDYSRVGSTRTASNGPTVSGEMSFTTDPTPGTDSPAMVQFPVIDYANDTIYLTFSKSNLQNVTMESNYLFSPSLLFRSPGASREGIKRIPKKHYHESTPVE